MRKLILALGAILLAAAAPPATDWSKTVVRSPDGAFLVGNPKAPKKLVEFASYTCGHCAEFSVEAAKELDEQIAAGKVRLEFRHALRDPVDLTAAMLARCAGPRGFLPATHAIYAAQGAWMNRAQSYVTGNKAALEAATPDKARLMVAKGSGLLAVVAPLGVTEAKAATCLASKAEESLLVAQANDAWSKRKIPGTPYFTLNGAALEANLWPGVKAEIAKP
ncbi:MAG: DsbA family protein [Erythrobacter sp.]